MFCVVLGFPEKLTHKIVRRDQPGPGAAVGTRVGTIGRVKDIGESTGAGIGVGTGTGAGTGTKIVKKWIKNATLIRVSE
jgi:hypothetical protein